ncbi:response regulator [Caldalkalibacillus mannanilyticus]|uniref:response regulator n=1 Tax=Caldalkalibacillus mannanilyticus TaxID=1418 RepID=UPI00046AF7F0|nr:response regulator [Caldalkalibacillus mannanilyticus]
MNLLLVDDDPLNIKVMSDLLSHENIHITSVTTGEEALQQVEDFSHWDLVILDLMLPGISGIEVCRTIREHHPLFQLPMLILTASGRTNDIMASFAAGANDFLTKPVQAAELRARVRTLLEMKKSVNERIRMESSFLQAQIKPHFLFNTLNSIFALSEDDPEQMRELLDQFTHYLQESYLFENHELLVPIQRELQLVRSYLYIEKVRFGHRLHYEIDMAEETNSEIPPFTLQPIVENAIHHGVLKKKEGGSIKIRIMENGDQLIICVSDDGVGMSNEKVKRIMSSIPLDGIGLKNVDLRMKRLYGRGISITTDLGLGTTVEMRIPKKR